MSGRSGSTWAVLQKQRKSLCVFFMGDSSGSLSAERSSVDSSVDSSVGSVGGTLVVLRGGWVGFYSRWSLEQSAASRSPLAGIHRRDGVNGLNRFGIQRAFIRIGNDETTRIAALNQGLITGHSVFCYGVGAFGQVFKKYTSSPYLQSGLLL